MNAMYRNDPMHVNVCSSGIHPWCISILFIDFLLLFGAPFYLRDCLVHLFTVVIIWYILYLPIKTDHCLARNHIAQSLVSVQPHRNCRVSRTIVSQVKDPTITKHCATNANDCIALHSFGCSNSSVPYFLASSSQPEPPSTVATTL